MVGSMKREPPVDIAAELFDATHYVSKCQKVPKDTAKDFQSLKRRCQGLGGFH